MGQKSLGLFGHKGVKNRIFKRNGALKASEAQTQQESSAPRVFGGRGGGVQR